MIFRLLVVPLIVVAKLRPVAETSTAHPELLDRDSERKLFEVTGVLALPLGRFDRLQEFFLRLALLALGDYLPRVLEGVEVFSSFIKSRRGIVSLEFNF